MNKWNLQVNEAAEGFDLSYDSNSLITGLTPELNGHNRVSKKTTTTSKSGQFGPCTEITAEYTVDGQLTLTLQIESYTDTVVLTAKPEREIKNKNLKDSFVETCFNLTTFQPGDIGCLLYTWGLRSSLDGYPGGSWPTALYRNSPKDIPEDEGFAPLALIDEEASLIVSPLNHYLLSPLTKETENNKPVVKRGLHGSVESLSRGDSLKTIFVAANNFKSAFHRWGNRLTSPNDKEAKFDEGDPLYSTLGHWNAYGGYYAELFSGYDEETLTELENYFREEDIPIGYFGLDLWYRYDVIGKAKSYQPNPKKYPKGLEKVTENTGLPLALHLSALDENNEFCEAGSDRNDINYREAYESIARRIKDGGGVAAWHDWLRAEQGMTEKLRKDPEAAKTWFHGMIEEFQKQDLSVLLCMETAGMLLASTAHKNVKYSRSYTDYLFKQKGQLAKLWTEGELGFSYEEPEVYLKQQILVGMLLDTLGLAPFNDLFISNQDHPEGFADATAKQEALLASLSSGPIGIGDKLGEVDKELVNKMAFPDGKLLKPEGPPFVEGDQLGNRILPAITGINLNGYRWDYLVLANVSSWPGNYNYEPKRADEYFIYNYSTGRVVEKVSGTVKAGAVDYYLLVPEINGIGLIGFIDKFITQPEGYIRDVRAVDHGLEMRYELQEDTQYQLGVLTNNEDSLKIDCKNGRIQKTEVEKFNHSNKNLHRLKLLSLTGQVRLSLYRGAK